MKAIWLMSATLFACGSNEAAVVPTTVTSAGMHVDVDKAADQITTDRCNRQLSCGNIGKDRMWRDRHACVHDMDNRVHSVIGGSCSSIDAMRLSTCLNEIREQSCLQSAELPASCGGVQLCR